ncbi:Fe-S cluster assembly protein HesB [Cohnella fermenti]|uniref:Fe-S cluster assembly protein HesB n=1 Tax=Cohnella fermenti TaxID=2565925 RepID=A0A4S4C4E3_9BACL|nr:Fe-S cluster assembly protein HesB [Cohnella fermenti]THF82645.1 Fe-S cluster assembly protein HesB [Cohnella fermenti]
MELVISPTAVSCFKNEWGYSSGDHVRIFVRYVSGGTEPYGFGIMKDDPMDPATIVEADRVNFYMESKDIWFLDSKQLKIDCLNGDIVFLVGDAS